MVSLRQIIAGTTVALLSSVSTAQDSDENGIPDACENVDFTCHIYCGGAARNARTCGTNEDYHPPFNHACLCDQGTEFLDDIYKCYDCGWAIWNSYGEYITDAIAECSLAQTEPPSDSCMSYFTTIEPEASTEPSVTSSEATTEETSAPETTTSAPAESTAEPETSGEPAESTAESSAEPETSGESTAESSAEPETSGESTESTAEPETSGEPTESTAESETSGEPTTSESESSSESQSSGSALATPSASGSVDADGNPFWIISIPGSLGPWTDVAGEFAKEGNFDYTEAAVILNQEPLNATSEVTAETVAVGFTESAPTDEVVEITIAGKFTGSGPATLSGTISVTTPDEQLAKRAVSSFDVEAVVENPNDASSSASSDASDSSSVSSESSDSNGTSVVTKSDIETTTFTTTSCSENKCSESTVTTGVTVVTTTEHGVVTVYTTYCPLSTSTVTEGPETTVVTITSCHENKCSEVPVTKEKSTVISTVTTTKAGPKETSDVTTYVTTYVTTKEVQPTVKPQGGSTTAHVISTFEGAGERLAIGSTFAAFVFGLLLI